MPIAVQSSRRLARGARFNVLQVNGALGVFRSSCKIKEIQLCQPEGIKPVRIIAGKPSEIARGKYFNCIGIFILFKRVLGWHGQTLFVRAQQLKNFKMKGSTDNPLISPFSKRD